MSVPAVARSPITSIPTYSDRATAGTLMDPWRYSTQGISVALRVTPRGGRDDIDGLETLANGRTVVKVRGRAIAEGGEANRAVAEVLAKALGGPKRDVRGLSG